MTLTYTDNEISPVVPLGEDDVRHYLNEIRRFPLLTAEQEKELARRCAEGDEEAIRHMVNSNLRLVVSVARDYAGRGVPLLDLIQEGSIGLIAAAKRFDYTLDFRFSTYATKWILQGVTRCLFNHGAVIRVPQHTAEKMRKIIAAKHVLMQENGVEPTAEEIAERTGLTADKVVKLTQLMPQTCSLDAPAGEEDTTLGSLLEDSYATRPQEQLIREELNRMLQQLMESLSDRQQLVLRMRYGLDDGVCRTLDEISAVLGISKERVRQLEQRAMDRLKKNGAGMGLEDFLE